ncbi:MAG: hypothetical protein VXW32_15055 [Myxococcota bacterium]|nr:hypothetical protein [Myxococcota bacterium]
MRALAVIFGLLASSLTWGSPEGPLANCENQEPLNQRLIAIESAIVDDELTAARQLVTDALDSLRCLTGVVDSASLSGVWQASAAIEFFGASESAAMRDMRRAKSIPGGEFRARLGVDLQRQWESAVPERSATLKVTAVPEGFQLFVDGALRPSPILELPSGPHVVQVVGGDALRFHRLVHLNHGQKAIVDTRLMQATSSSGPAFRTRRVLLWSGLTSGVLSLGSYGLAVSHDRQMMGATTKAEIERLRGQSLRYRNASWILGAAAGVGVGLYGLF